MKKILLPSLRCLSGLILWFASADSSVAQRIVTPNGSSMPYYFSATGTNVAAGAMNQTITLTAGATYQFTIATDSLHPVDINTTTSIPIPRYSNATPQAINSGTITLTIPATGYPSNLYYICNNHGFFGLIKILPPPAPPANKIVSVQVATNIILKSTGTKTSYILVPEFSSNLLSGTWLPVTVYSNTFNGGTNVTVFDRLDDVCGSNVFLRISQRPPS